MLTSDYAVFLTAQEEDMPFYVASIGNVKSQKRVHRPLGIEHHQFLFTLKGKGCAFINGQTFELGSGDILYLPPHTAHEYYCADGVWETQYITFGGNGLERFWEFEPSVWSNGKELEFEKWFELLLVYKSKIGMEKNLSLSLYAMLLEFGEKVNGLSATKKKRHIITLAMQELSKVDNTDLNFVAKKVGVSASHLCRIFKEYTGFRPVEYLNRLKIHKAKEMLVNTEMSIREIGEILGYESHSYFSMMFKRYTGVTPTEYKKSV